LPIKFSTTFGIDPNIFNRIVHENEGIVYCFDPGLSLHLASTNSMFQDLDIAIYRKITCPVYLSG